MQYETKHSVHEVIRRKDGLILKTEPIGYTWVPIDTQEGRYAHQEALRKLLNKDVVLSSISTNESHDINYHCRTVAEHEAPELLPLSTRVLHENEK